MFAHKTRSSSSSSNMNMNMNSSSSSSFPTGTESSHFSKTKLLSPTSRKRRVLQVERTTGPLSPMMGRARARARAISDDGGSGRLSPGHQQSMMRPAFSSPISHSHSHNVTSTSTSTGSNHHHNHHHHHHQYRYQPSSPVNTQQQPPPQSRSGDIPRRSDSTESTCTMGSLHSHHSTGSNHHTNNNINHSNNINTSINHKSNHKSNPNSNSNPKSAIMWWQQYLGAGRHQKKQLRRWMRQLIKLGPLVQLLFLVVVLLMVVQSHYHAQFAESQLLRYRQDESSLLLQLQKIERHSMQLHQNIRTRLQKASGVVAEAATAHVQLLAQQEQLQEMSQELHGQVRVLQESIQHEARKNIIHEFGEGPVKVVLELEFDVMEDTLSDTTTGTTTTTAAGGAAKRRRRDKAHATVSTTTTTHLDILLWPETPHAGWTLLEQLGRHVWDGAEFHWSSGQPILDITPVKEDPLRRGHLQFAEYLPDVAQQTRRVVSKDRRDHRDGNTHGGAMGTNHRPPPAVAAAGGAPTPPPPNHYHSAWTVGLREHPSQPGQLQLFLNLQDNGQYYPIQHETCIGKIMGGFDTLQRALSETRNNNNNNNNNDGGGGGGGGAQQQQQQQQHQSAVVTIRHASAMHVSKRELDMI